MPQKKTTLEIIKKINNYWQQENPKPKWTFWDAAVYYTDNMEAYQITKMDAYKKYAESWAEENRWEGAKSKDKNNWKYTYGESDDFVLFGDWQICFQTYIDLYSLDDVKDNNKIFRAKEVMEYQMKTSKNNYWWWADGLFMAMPVMTKLYTITGNQQYLDKLYECFQYADSPMYDKAENIYYRDAKYVYPKHKTINGEKIFGQETMEGNLQVWPKFWPTSL